MTDELRRGTLEHCLAQGVWAERLLKRFRAVVSEEEMALVQYWFEELHRKADLYLRQGHELVSVGIENREEWHAGPFMVFNPTKWTSHRRELVAPTPTRNPRKWVSIHARSFTKPRHALFTSDRAYKGTGVFAAPLPEPGLSGSTRIPLDVDSPLLPVLEAELCTDRA